MGTFLFNKLSDYLNWAHSKCHEFHMLIRNRLRQSGEADMMGKQKKYQRFIPCSCDIPHLSWVWRAGWAEGDPLVHLIVQGFWLEGPPPSATQFRVPRSIAASSYSFSPRMGRITPSHSALARTGHVVPPNLKAAAKWDAVTEQWCFFHKGSSGDTKMEQPLIVWKCQVHNRAYTMLSPVRERGKGTRKSPEAGWLTRDQRERGMTYF